MTTATTTDIHIPALGAYLPEQGGYFHGIYLLDGHLWGEVTAPKAGGELLGVKWHSKYSVIKGASSDWDGLANTQAMARAGSELAKHALALDLGGHTDWYLPARGGVLQQWGIRKALPKSEQFAKRSHWTSTQYDRLSAFGQSFSYGHTHILDKGWEGGAARFARRFPLS